jgi:hypothetical protein
MVHSLEHHPFPLEALKTLRSFLADEGVLAIWVPNANFLPTQRRGLASDPGFVFPMHLHYFTPRSMAVLLELAGFTPLEIATTGNLSFQPNMAEDLLVEATGRAGAHLKNPQAVLDAMSDNLLSYEIRALAVRSDSRAHSGKGLKAEALRVL